MFIYIVTCTGTFHSILNDIGTIVISRINMR